MMKTIWKFPLKETRIKMPMGAQPLHVGLDPAGTPSIWCLVDDMNPGRWYDVPVAVTGGEAPEGRHMYVGSFVDGAFVGHVFFDRNWSITK